MALPPIPLPPVPLPAEVVATARAYADGQREPVEPRDAATVILLRPADGPPGRGPAVYYLRRQTSMRFAGGMCVYPGGGVDRRDFDADVAWAGPGPQEWAGRLGCEEELARALVCAAVRETFEESGVLLAGPGPDQVVADTTGEDWEADRLALESHDLALTELLTRRGLVLRTDLLGVWGGWTTPAFEPRRFRTWFFVALLPQGQRTRDVSTESSEVAWIAALDAVAQAESGAMGMMPPTYLTSLEVGQHPDPASVMDAARDRVVQMHTPEVAPFDDGHTLTLPEHHRPLLAAHHAAGGGPATRRDRRPATGGEE